MGSWWFGGKGSMGPFGRNRRGNVAMLWALMATALVGTVGISVDFTRAQMIRVQLQNAADGAALAAARDYGATLTQRTAVSRAYFDAEAGDNAAIANFSLTPLPDGTYRVQVSAPMQMSLTSVISNNPWTIAVASDAVQSGVNLEVALVLDTTGSMGSGTKIADMRNAATNLVNTVVRA